MSSAESSSPLEAAVSSYDGNGRKNLQLPAFSQQSFYVLPKGPSLPHRDSIKVTSPSKSKKTRRKIDLSPQSFSDESSLDMPHIHDQLRLEAFQRTWALMDSTIKEVLHDFNIKLFNQVLQWVMESLSNVKSHSKLSVEDIRQPCPIEVSPLCRKIPTTFILTRNADVVDDIQMFEELGRHLKSNRCHVANLSPFDFLAKHGLIGCVKALLRQLIPESHPEADISALHCWHSVPENYDMPIVVVIEALDQCCDIVLSDFIMTVSEWVIKIPIFFVIGVGTTLDSARKCLPSDVLLCLQPCKLTLGSPMDKIDSLVETVLVNQNSLFRVGHRVAVFLKNYFKHDGTITSFINALKLACSKHFSVEPLSFLFLGLLDNFESPKVSKGKSAVLLEHILKYPCDQLSSKREKATDGIGDGTMMQLLELKNSQSKWSSVVQCLFEAGKQTKVQLLNLYCEATDPDLYRLWAKETHKAASRENPSTKKFCSGRYIDQAIRAVRELPQGSLPIVLERWSTYTEDLKEINEKVKDLLKLATQDSPQICQSKKTNIRRSLPYSRGQGTPSLNDKAAILLDFMVREFLVPLECIPFHEVVCFSHLEVLQSALIGDPWKTIQLDLMRSQSYLKCTCCSKDRNSMSASSHDSTIMYNLSQDYGDSINVHDWYLSFKETVSTTHSKRAKKSVRSPAPKKLKASETEAAIQARFSKAVIDLQITGLLRFPSKRRPDFVQRIVFSP